MAAKKREEHEHFHQAKVTIAQAVRDVLLGALDKGMFLPAIVALLLVIFMVRMPENELVSLAREVVATIRGESAYVWIALIIMLVAYPAQATILNRKFREELNRVVEERNDLQAMLVDDIESSEQAI